MCLEFQVKREDRLLQLHQVTLVLVISQSEELWKCGAVPNL